MRKLYEMGKKGSRGLAMLLSALLIFSMIFTGSVMQVHADPVVCSLTVSANYAEHGFIKYSENGVDWTEVGESGTGNTPVSASAIQFFPEENYHVSSMVINGNTVNNPSRFYDFTDDSAKSITSVTFEADGDPEPCQLTVASYTNTYGKIYYTADLDGDDNWVEVGASGTASAVPAFRVKGVPTSDDYTVSYTLNSTNITDDGDHGLFPEVETNTVTNITFAERSPGGGDPVIQIQSDSYDATNGKIQYSVNETDWTDIPAAGLASNIDAAFVRAVPNEGYSVSYKIDNNVVNNTNVQSLGTSPALHYIQDIAFMSLNKSLTVTSYVTTGGKIQYSTNGTDWTDVPAAGVTAVPARYVKAVPASGHVVDSYRLNSSTIVSGEQQTLTADNNTISNISFAETAGGGKYLLSIDNQTSVACAVTVTFLNSSGESLGTASAGNAADIPAGTARIRIALDHEEFLKSIQIFRNTAPAAPGSNGATEIARPSGIEEGLWRNGSAEFSASNSYSYKFAIELSNTKNIGWSYRSSDRGTDLYVEHCRLYLLDSNGQRRAYVDESDSNRATTDYASYNLTVDQTYKFELVPDYGYQVAGLRINGYTVAPTNDMGIFSFTMSNTNFHFSGVVTPTSDIVVAPAAYSGATISGGSNATNSGNAKVTITEETTDNSAAAVVGEDATAVATLDIDLAKAVYKGSAGQYWTENLTTTSGNVTMSLPVSASGLGAGQTYTVVREHGGQKTEIPATYNSTTGMLTFGSNKFSNYTIVKKAGTPETGSGSSSSGSSSSESSSSDSSDDDDSSSTPATSGSSAGFSGVVNNSTSNGGAVISSWSQLDNVLKANGDISVLGAAAAAGTTDTNAKTGSSNGKSGNAGSQIVSVTLTGNTITVPESTFAALDNSKVDGLHIFTSNGVALTFLKNSGKTKQGAVDIAANVTKGKGFTKIAFKKPQALITPTALHATVPKGTKTVKLSAIGPDGKKYFVTELKPLADGQVAFLIGALGTYELDY